MKIKWECPRCGAGPNGHGKGGYEKCHGVGSGQSNCQGFLCECDGDDTEEHGQTFKDVCENASCYHCGWAGAFPVKPKKLQAWEKKALEAGWTPPEARQIELGLK